MWLKNYKLALLAVPCALTLLMACSHRPDKVLPEGKMADVLADMLLEEAYVSRPYVVMVSDSSKKAIRQTVFKQHNITQEEFDSTLNWYGHHLDKYAVLYDKVGKRILKKQESFWGEEPQVSLDESMWQLPMMISVGPNAPTAHISFSIAGSSVKPGDVLEWQMRFNRIVGGGTLVLAAEYGDYDMAVARKGFRDNGKLTLRLTTDSLKSPKRIIGYIHFSSTPARQAWIDSISLTSYPKDKMPYEENGRFDGGQREMRISLKK
jgi:hypothetical protein